MSSAIGVVAAIALLAGALIVRSGSTGGRSACCIPGSWSERSSSNVPAGVCAIFAVSACGLMVLSRAGIAAARR